MKPPLFLFGQQAILKVFQANDAYGDKIYGEITTLDPTVVLNYDTTSGEYTIKCRFEPQISSVRNPDQEQKTFTGTIFTLGTDIPTQSELIFDGRTYIVGDCLKHYAPTGISHLEVLLT